MSLTRRPQKHATTRPCGSLRLQNKEKKRIPLKPGCLPMYLYNLSPAEDGIRFPARARHWLHPFARTPSTCDSATPSYPATREISFGEVLPAMARGIQYRNSRRLHLTQDYGRGRAAEQNRCSSHESNLRARFVPRHGDMTSYSNHLARAPARTPHTTPTDNNAGVRQRG